MIFAEIGLYPRTYLIMCDGIRTLTPARVSVSREVQCISCGSLEIATASHVRLANTKYVVVMLWSFISFSTMLSLPTWSRPRTFQLSLRRSRIGTLGVFCSPVAILPAEIWRATSWKASVANFTLSSPDSGWRRLLVAKRINIHIHSQFHWWVFLEK